MVRRASPPPIAVNRRASPAMEPQLRWTAEPQPPRRRARELRGECPVPSAFMPASLAANRPAKWIAGVRRREHRRSLVGEYPPKKSLPETLDRCCNPGDVGGVETDAYDPGHDDNVCNSERPAFESTPPPLSESFDWVQTDAGPALVCSPAARGGGAFVYVAALAPCVASLGDRRIHRNLKDGPIWARVIGATPVNLVRVRQVHGTTVVVGRPATLQRSEADVPRGR